MWVRNHEPSELTVQYSHLKFLFVIYPHLPPHCTALVSDSQGSPIADDDAGEDSADEVDVEAQQLQEGGARKRRRSKQAWSALPSHAPDPKVKIALSLYKVQQNIYLLDFQRVEVRTVPRCFRCLLC